MTTKSHQRDIGVKVVPHKHRVVKDLKATAAEEQQLVVSEHAALPNKVNIVPLI